MLYFKSCPRCQGDVNVENDSHGTYAKCLQCGFSRDLPKDWMEIAKARADGHPAPAAADAPKKAAA